MIALALVQVERTVDSKQIQFKFKLADGPTAEKTEQYGIYIAGDCCNKFLS